MSGPAKGIALVSVVIALVVAVLAFASDPLGALAVILIAFLLAAWYAMRDPKLSAEVTATALQKELGRLAPRTGRGPQEARTKIFLE